MEETIQFIYQEIRNHNVNIGGQVNDVFPEVRIARQIPTIRNNFPQAITLLTDEGILEERDNTHFLTKHGFEVIYNN